MWVRKIACRSETARPCKPSCSRRVESVDPGPGSTIALVEPVRSRAAAIDRGRPVQFNSSAVVQFTEQEFTAFIFVAVKNKGLPEPSGLCLTLRKHLQNDELVEYALGAAACSRSYLAN